MASSTTRDKVLLAASWAAWLAGGLACGLLGGAWILRLAMDPFDAGDAEAWMQPLITVALALASLLSRVFITRKHGARPLALGTTAAAIVFMGLLVFLDVAAWALLPRWPARALHGVAPHPGTNTWGQKDVDHAEQPAEGVTRVVMVGDSFLEEGEAPPLPSRIGTRLGAGFEVVNLGVSATAPDEYFYRAKHIGLPMKPAYVVMVLYAGNDFMWHRTLHTWWGVMATAPRPSLFSLVGLGPLEHAWMNRLRPYIRAWGRAGEMAAGEMALFERVKAADDAALRAIIVERAPEAVRARVKEAMQKPGAEKVMHALRNPPQGLFRSYYLGHAYDALARERAGADNIDIAVEFTRRTARACADAGVRFTAVVMPEAAAVDDAFVETWGALADLRAYLHGKEEAAQAAVDALRKDGVDVLDMTPVLRAAPGAYLVLDGHLAARGQDVTADAIAAHVGRTR